MVAVQVTLSGQAVLVCDDVTQRDGFRKLSQTEVVPMFQVTWIQIQHREVGGRCFTTVFTIASVYPKTLNYVFSLKVGTQAGLILLYHC